MKFRMIAVIATIALACPAATAAPQVQPPAAVDSHLQLASCGWYAIISCGRHPGVRGPGRVIWTSDYPNFAPGHYCNVIGPSSYSRAMSNANRYGGYSKSAC